MSNSQQINSKEWNASYFPISSENNFYFDHGWSLINQQMNENKFDEQNERNEDLLDVLQTLITSDEEENNIIPNMSNSFKRKKNYRSIESNQRRNQRRRVHYFPRILKRDIRREYMNYYVNVMNASDISLMSSYLRRFYHPNVIICKSESVDSKISSPSSPSPTILVRGRNILSTQYAYRIHEFPDYIMNISNTRLSVNPLANQSVIISDYEIQSTKVQAHLSHYQSMLQRIIEIVEEKENESTNILTTSASSLPSSSSNQIIEYEPQEYFHHRLFISSEKNRQLKTQLQSFVSSYQTMNPQLHHTLSSEIEDDPIVCLNPQIKSILQGSIYMYLDENYMITRIDTKMASLQLEPIFINP